MTTFTKEDVDAYAKSLLIGLTEEENKMVILKMIGGIYEKDTNRFDNYTLNKWMWRNY